MLPWHAQQQVNPTALGLRTVLARYHFFASLVLLNDVLSAVNRLTGQDSLATEKIEVLLDHYQSLAESPEGQAGCVDEYVSFVKDHAMLKTCQSLQQLALEFLSKDACTQLFPTILKLLVHALVLPMTTTDCERCFSAMNRTKTDYRNRMHTETLDRLLRVKIEGPPLQDFIFREAIVQWSKVKKTQTFWKLIFPFFL